MCNFVLVKQVNCYLAATSAAQAEGHACALRADWEWLAAQQRGLRSSGRLVEIRGLGGALASIFAIMYKQSK